MKSRIYPITKVSALPNLIGNSKFILQLLCQVALSVAAIFILSGCSKRYDDMPAFLPFNIGGDSDNHSVGRFKTSYLAEQIDNYYRGANPGPIGVTTFVDLDDLYRTSTFGRVLSEQLMSELSMRGFEVVELRHADALEFIDGDGEFSLSRRPGATKKSRELGGVVVGTYVSSPLRVYLNARVIDPSTSMIVSSGSVEMSKSREIARLIRGGLPTSLERIPVKHMGLAQVPMQVHSYNHAYDLEESGATAVVPTAPAEPPMPEFGPKLQVGKK